MCARQATAARRRRRINASESQLALQVLETLSWHEGQTPRQLYERLAEGQKDRRSFERLLEGLAGIGLVEMREDAFSRNGKIIAFWRVYLTEAGQKAGIGVVGTVRLTEAVAAPVVGKRMAKIGRLSKA